MMNSPSTIAVAYDCTIPVCITRRAFEPPRTMRPVRFTIPSTTVVSNPTESYDVPNFQKSKEGRNGEGDPWNTDGNLAVGVTAD